MFRELAAGDFSRPLQGQTEELINQLCLRASFVPWQLCAIAVDEIESLVMSRSATKESSAHLSVLLSRIGGMSDIPNLTFFAATNMKNSIDDAFLRRMGIKIFVGSPSIEGRREWVEFYLQVRKT